MDSSTVQNLLRTDADHAKRLQSIERQIGKLPLRMPPGGGGSGGAGSGSDFEIIIANTWGELSAMTQSAVVKLGCTVVDFHFGVWVVNRWMCLSHFVNVDESET